MTRGRAGHPDRRSAILGFGALVAAGAGPATAQTAGVEVLATGDPGDGDDQLARAVAEGLGTTLLLPRAIAVNAPREAEALAEFVDGKRPRASLMVVGLSSVGTLVAAGRGGLLDGARPLARLTGERQPIVVPDASPIRSLADLMAAIAKDAESVVWTGRAHAGADHLLCLQLTIAAGGDPRRASFRPVGTSARASVEALTGKAMVATGALMEFVQQIRGGAVRALAIASPDRAPGVDVPTLREQGVDVAMLNWRGLLTRDAVGRALIERFDEALARLVLVPGWRQLLNQRHWAGLYQPGEDFGRFLADERMNVAALLKRSGIV